MSWGQPDWALNSAKVEPSSANSWQNLAECGQFCGGVDRIWAEFDQMWAEGNKLWTDFDKCSAEPTNLGPMLTKLGWTSIERGPDSAKRDRHPRGPT